MKSLLPLLALTLTATPALSLSCLRPDVVRSYEQAAAAEEVYMVVKGTLSLNPESVEGEPTAQTPVTFPATLTGAFLKDDGFHGAFAAPLIVSLDCVASWCARAPAPSTEVLAYVQQTDYGFRLALGPCGGWMFADPTDAQIARVAACHAGGDCQVEQ